MSESIKCPNCDFSKCPKCEQNTLHNHIRLVNGSLCGYFYCNNKECGFKEASSPQRGGRI